MYRKATAFSMFISLVSGILTYFLGSWFVIFAFGCICGFVAASLCLQKEENTAFNEGGVSKNV